MSIPEMTKAVEAAYSADLFFANLKNRWGTQLYKYSLSGVAQLGRWDIDASSGLHHDDDEIRDVTTIATLCIVLLAAKFLASQKRSVDCKQIEALAGNYDSRRATFYLDRLRRLMTNVMGEFSEGQIRGGKESLTRSPRAPRWNRVI